MTVVRPMILLPADLFGAKIGGIQTFVREVVRFAPEDFEIECIGCTSEEELRPVGHWRDLEVSGRRVRYKPILRTVDVHRRTRIPLSFRFAIAALRRVPTRDTGGRILQFHHPGVPAAFLTHASPKIHVVHLNPAEIDRGGGESRWSLVPGLLHRFEDVTLPRMDRIFVVNRAGVEFYRVRHPSVAQKTEFLPTMVDPSRFYPRPEIERQAERRALRERMGLDSLGSEPLILFVGRLERQKDPRLLIRSFAAATDMPDARLLIVGEGGLRHATEQLADELGVAGRTHWLGYQAHDTLPALMNAVDLLVLPSVFEGMPITVLEALACGLPVVSSAVGEVPTLVRHQANGWLVSDREPASFAAGITWIAGRPRAAFAEAARAATARFRPDEVLRPFYDAHRDLHDRRWGASSGVA